MAKREIINRICDLLLVFCIVVCLVVLPISVMAAGETGGDAGVEDTGSGDTGAEDTGSGDTGSGDTGSGDTGSGDTGAEDTGSGDTGSGDTGSGDTGAEDTGAEDTGAEDTGAEDTGAEDTGAEDTGAEDTGAEDTGAGDTGAEDTGAEDTGAEDTGAEDTGIEDDFLPDYPETPSIRPGEFYEQPIRVDNELNEQDSSSDTMLWPLDTTEENGVSTTVVSTREIDALLKTAEEHEDDVAQLPGDSQKEAVIVIEDQSAQSDNHTYQLQIGQDQYLKLMEQDWDRLTVQTPAGGFGIDSGILDMASKMLENTAGKLDMSLETLDNNGRPGLDVTLKVAGEVLSEFETTPYGVRVFIPYTPAEGEDVNSLIVEYLPEDGEPIIVRECTYNEKLGGLVLYVSHLSKFGVAYRPATFKDVGPDHWANPYVTFLAARGIVSGRTDALYRPDEPATRAEFAALLAKTFSAANLPARPVQTYRDVSADSYLAAASNWLYYNNLAAEITSGNRFRPNENITRQDMATLLNNVITGMGVRLRSQGLDTEYTDFDQIAPYAKDAVERLRAAGVLDMAANYKFNPTATINRGEMAKIIATLLSLM